MLGNDLWSNQFSLENNPASLKEMKKYVFF